MHNPDADVSAHLFAGGAGPIGLVESVAQSRDAAGLIAKEPICLKKVVLTLAASMMMIAVPALATRNGWWAKQAITQVAVLDSDVGPICEFALADNTIWAFKVSSHETTVELVKTAVLNAKPVYVNYGNDATFGNPPGDFLTFTPLNGTTQKLALAYGVALPK